MYVLPESTREPLKPEKLVLSGGIKWKHRPKMG